MVTQQDRPLLAELIVQIALRLARDGLGESEAIVGPRAPDEAHLRGVVIGHSYISIFEEACSILEAVDVLAPLTWELEPYPADKTMQPPCYRILHDADDIRRKAASAARLSPDVTLQNVLVCFLKLACDYGGAPLSEKRKAFQVAGRFRPLLGLLEARGLVRCSGDMATWTDAIAPYMRMAELWDEEDRTHEDVLQAEVERMWTGMPADIRQLLTTSDDIVSTLAHITSAWRDGKWHAERIHDPMRLRFPQPSPEHVRRLMRRARSTIH